MEPQTGAMSTAPFTCSRAGLNDDQDHTQPPSLQSKVTWQLRLFADDK